MPKRKTDDISKKNHKICLIFPYFGKWPSYLPFFAASLKLNPEIDFIFFSNDKQPDYLKGSNIIYKSLTINKFNKIASEKLGFPVLIKNAQKLCDFKPTYGHLFEDYIKDYAYWGYGDVDVIYGQLSSFLDPIIKLEYDIISTKERLLHGPLTFYKNSDVLKTLYTQSKHYKEVLQSDRIEVFDEGGQGTDRLIFKKTFVNELRQIPESMTSVVYRLSQQNKITAYFQTLVYDIFELEVLRTNAWCLEWTSNGLKDIVQNKAVLFFHSIRYKSKPNFFPKWKKIPSKFYITQYGIFKTINDAKFSYYRNFFPDTYSLFNKANASINKNKFGLPDITTDYYKKIADSFKKRSNNLSPNKKAAIQDLLKLEIIKKEIYFNSSTDISTSRFWTEGFDQGKILQKDYAKLDVINTPFQVNKHMKFIHLKWNWTGKELTANFGIPPQKLICLAFAQKLFFVTQILINDVTKLIIEYATKHNHFEFIYESILNHFDSSTETEKFVIKQNVIMIMLYLFAKNVFIVDHHILSKIADKRIENEPTPITTT